MLNDSTWHWWLSPEVTEEGRYGKCGSFTHCAQPPTQRWATRRAEPVGEASTWMGFADVSWCGRRGTPSSVLMAGIRSEGLNAASRCASSLPGMFRGETGTHLRGWHQLFMKLFLTILCIPGGGLCVVLVGLPLTQNLRCCVMLVCFLFYLPRLWTLEDRDSVSYHCFNSQCLGHIMCSLNVC